MKSHNNKKNIPVKLVAGLSPIGITHLSRTKSPVSLDFPKFLACTMLRLVVRLNSLFRLKWPATDDKHVGEYDSENIKLWHCITPMNTVWDKKYLPVARFARELIGVWCLLLSLTFVTNRLPSLLRRVWSCYMLTCFLAICTDIIYHNCVNLNGSTIYMRLYFLWVRA